MKRIYQSLSISIILIIAVVCSGCLIRSVESGTVKIVERQFLIWSTSQDFSIESNGVIRAGAVISQADTNGISAISDVISAAVAAAVKAGLVSALAAQNPNADGTLYGSVFRAKNLNGKPGPWDIQIVPVAGAEDKK